MDQRLKLIALEMEKRGVDAFIVPSADAHQTEMVADKDQRRAWVSGFTGSAGTAVLVKNRSSKSVSGLLWTDGRYFTQALQELDENNWTLMKEAVKGTPTIGEYITSKEILDLIHGETLATDTKIGVDPNFSSVPSVKNLFKKVSEANERIKKKNNKSYSFELLLERNLIDSVKSISPEVEAEDELEKAIFQFPETSAGESFASKVKRLRKQLFIGEDKEKGVFVINELSEICWITNLRGRHLLPTSPLIFAFAILTPQQFFLFLDVESSSNKNKDLEKYIELQKAHVEIGLEIYPYDKFEEKLKTIVKEDVAELSNKLVYMPYTANYSMYDICREVLEQNEKTPDDFIKFIDSPVATFKALKNKREIESMKKAHVEDAVALVQFFQWMEIEVAKGTKIDEVEASDKLLEFRKMSPLFDTVSFETISGYGSNGAIIHYKPEKDSPLLKTIGSDNLYLVDSGGQYSCGGTTDITRTVHFGEPTEDQKRFFTLVLEGHAQFALSKFPEGTAGFKLGTIARQPLWTHAEDDYAHSTGHGVGCYLNVHEFPPAVSYRKSAEVDTNKLLPGHIISNEPGYYRVDGFGIRIENLHVIKLTETSKEKPLTNTVGVKFCEFDTLSLFPMQKKLIDLNILSKNAQKWVNSYHKECLDIVGPRLKELGLNDAYAWLEKNTSEIGELGLNEPPAKRRK